MSVSQIQRVDEFVVKVNTTLHQKQEHERLSMIIDRIEAYDIIDFPNEECTKVSRISLTSLVYSCHCVTNDDVIDVSVT